CLEERPDRTGEVALAHLRVRRAEELLEREPFAGVAALQNARMPLREREPSGARGRVAIRVAGRRETDRVALAELRRRHDVLQLPRPPLHADDVAALQAGARAREIDGLRL